MADEIYGPLAKTVQAILQQHDGDTVIGAFSESLGQMVGSKVEFDIALVDKAVLHAAMSLAFAVTIVARGDTKRAAEVHSEMSLDTQAGEDLLAKFKKPAKEK